MGYNDLSLQLSSVQRRKMLLMGPVKQSFLESNNLVLNKRYAHKQFIDSCSCYITLICCIVNCFNLQLLVINAYSQIPPHWQIQAEHHDVTTLEECYVLLYSCLNP